MKDLFFFVIFLATAKFSIGGPLRLQKRAAFYIANETACVVDSTVYSNGDPIPTDDPCEACKCRPPGFACVLKECEVKPGCRAVRRAGHCCPEYICGCEHNGRMYRDGDEIQDSQNPCYTCHCQGSSIACAFVDCFFRVDCAPEYVAGECCPRYTHCSSVETNTSEADISSFDVKTDSDIEITTISDTTTSKSTQLYTDEVSSDVTHDETIEEQAPSEPPIEPKSPDQIHFISDVIKEFASETEDRVISLSTQTSQDTDATTQSIQSTDSTESQDSAVSETVHKSELLNTEFEIKDEENVEESQKSGDEESSETTTADSDTSVPTEANISKGNVEIFADETGEEHTFEATTATQDLPASELKTTEVPIKHETEIETNTIEKRFRSYENASLESPESETTETKEQSENGHPTNTEVPEDVSTEAQEKHSTFQNIEASTPVPEVDASPESLESKDTTSSDHNDQTTSTDKNPEKLYYNAEEKILVPTSLETVTAVVHVHEETSSSEKDATTITSVSSGGDERNLSTQTDIPKDTSDSVTEESLKNVAN